MFQGCEQLDFDSIPEDLKWNFPDAFPQEVIGRYGYVKDSCRADLLKAYQARHEQDRADVEEELAYLRDERREAEAAEAHASDRKERNEATQRIDELRERMRVVRARIAAYDDPSDDDLLEEYLQD